MREGYAAWAPTYEDTVEDVMDLALLDRIDSVPWRSVDAGRRSGLRVGPHGALAAHAAASSRSTAST